MTRQEQFLLGGLGGLLPILASLIAVDLTTISNLIDRHQLTEGLMVGYALRVICWFSLGGVMGAVNSDVKSPLAVLQLGIAAPALVTSYLGGVAVLGKDEPNPAHAFNVVSAAYASPLEAARVEKVDFLNEVGKGLFPGLGQRNPVKPMSAPTPSQPAYRIVNSAAGTCLNISPAELNAPDGLAKVQATIPPGYTLEKGACP